MYSDIEIDYETDDESYLSEDDDKKCYEPEEESQTKYNIVLCELYNKNIHGISENKTVKYNYLTICRYKVFNKSIYNDAKYYNYKYNSYYNIKNHEIYKNYKNIISKPNYIKPEISECIYLKSGECISILKTYLIRLIQRTWKNIYKKRIEIMKIRFQPNSIKYREIYGRWPDKCIVFPTIKGMLLYLK